MKGRSPDLGRHVCVWRGRRRLVPEARVAAEGPVQAGHGVVRETVWAEVTVVVKGAHRGRRLWRSIWTHAEVTGKERTVVHRLT